MPHVNELKISAEQGDPEAQYNLGTYFESEKNIPEACKWFEEAAEQNHTDSQFKLGFFYRWGDDGFPADIEKGRFWLTQAAEQGNVKAQFHLGNLYNEGQAFDEAAKWFEKAARQGEERAMFRFALINESGLYADSRIGTAIEYYTKLSEAPYNHKDAMINLGIIYCSNDKIQRDASKGKRLIEKCKPFRGIEAYDCYRIGVLYCTGEININNEPTVEDLDTGVGLLNIAIQDGLVGYHPGNIDLAMQLREVATKRKANLIDMKNNIVNAQKIEAEEKKAASREAKAKSIKRDIDWEQSQLNRAYDDYQNKLQQARNVQVRDTGGWGNLGTNMAQGMLEDSAKKFYYEEKNRIESRISKLQNELKNV